MECTFPIIQTSTLALALAHYNGYLHIKSKFVWKNLSIQKVVINNFFKPNYQTFPFSPQD